MEVTLQSSSHCSELLSSLSVLHNLNLEYLYDIKILLSTADATESVGSTCEAQVINTHKIILAASSKWFYQLTLDGTLNCTEIIIPGKILHYVQVNIVVSFASIETDSNKLYTFDVHILPIGPMRYSY